MDKKTPEERAALWQQRFKIAKDHQQPMFEKFRKWFNLFNATVSTENISPWRSKVFIPIIAGKVWSLVSKFVGLKPGFEVNLRDPNMSDEVARERADKMQKKLEYDYENPHLDEPIRDKLIAPLIDASVTGTGFAKVPWRVKNKKRYERMIGDDGTVDLTKAKEYEKKYGCNDLIPVNIFNVFVAPTAVNLYAAPWIMIREHKTIDELKDVNDAEGTEVYKNLDQLQKARQESDEFAQYNKARNSLMNNDDKISLDTTVDHIAVFECYAGDMMYTYASSGTKNKSENWVEIRKAKNYYWHGKYPLVRFVVKQRPYDFWGQGLYELTERLQSATNDVFNHHMDNFNLAVDGMLMIEESSNINDYVIQPGGEITYRGTPPQQFKFPEPNPAAMSTVMNMIEKSIEDVTVSSYATGAPNSATDKTQGTATGILRLQEAAGDIISFMRTNFQQSIHQVGQMWLSNNQQFVDQTVQLESQNGAQKEHIQITPMDLQGDMELRIDDASMQPATKEERRDAQIQFTQQALGLKQASDQQAQQIGTKPIALDYGEMLGDLADEFGNKNPDKYLLSDEEIAESQQEQTEAKSQQMQSEAQMMQQQQQLQQQAMPQQGMQPGMEGQPQGMPPEQGLPPEGMEQQMGEMPPPQNMPQEMPQELPPEMQGEGEPTQEELDALEQMLMRKGAR